MRGIEPDRRQQGPHLAQKEIGDPGAFGGRTVGTAEKPHAACRQCRQDLIVERAILIVDQRSRGAADFNQQRAHRTERHSRGRHLRPQLLLQAGDADLEIFIEIAAQNAEEAQPLEQRHVGILREGEHATIEREQ